MFEEQKKSRTAEGEWKGEGEARGRSERWGQVGHLGGSVRSFGFILKEAGSFLQHCRVGGHEP